MVGGMAVGGHDFSTAEDEDEMVATERELAEDAEWKKIQQNTFTRWANEHLKTVEKHIGNLETDLSDGLRLITLIEVLSGRKLPKHNKRPSFRSQKLENVSVALRFLQEDEGIRIVNIGKEKVLFIHAARSLFLTCFSATNDALISHFTIAYFFDDIVLTKPAFLLHGITQHLIRLNIFFSPVVMTTKSCRLNIEN